MSEKAIEAAARARYEAIDIGPWDDLCQEDKDALLRTMRHTIAAYEAEKEPPLTASQLADALGCFWNAAIGSAHETQNSSAFAMASVMAQGFAAVQARLNEFAINSKTS